MFRLQKNCSDPFFGPFILQVIQKHNCTEAKTIFCFEKIAEYLIYGSSLVFDFTGSMELQPCKSSKSSWCILPSLVSFVTPESAELPDVRRTQPSTAIIIREQ